MRNRRNAACKYNQARAQDYNQGHGFFTIIKGVKILGGRGWLDIVVIFELTCFFFLIFLSVKIKIITQFVYLYFEILIKN